MRGKQHFSLAKKIPRVTTSNQCFAFTSSQFKPRDIQYLAEDEDVEVELKIPSSPAGSFSLKVHTHLILISKVCAPLEGSLAAASDLVRLLMVLEEGVE